MLIINSTIISFCALQLFVQGKLPLTGITVTGIEDTDEIRNALEITGIIIIIIFMYHNSILQQIQ